jgi:anti-sigma regulatory factor (Ser/Thr protein kinase)
MGQLRSALGSLSMSSNAPGSVLDLLDRFVYRIDGGESATVAYAVLDVVTGVLRYASAGHPPPLVLEPAAAPRFLEDGRSWPLGIGQAPRPRPDAATRLPPGSAVVLYTDGLVEQRKTPLDERLAALAAAADAGPFDDPAEVCDRLLTAMLVGEQPDDVALLTVVYDPALASKVHWAFPATPTSIREARGVVRRWLERRGMTPDASFDLVLAADEACANAVEHGSRGPDDAVELTMFADDDGAVVITVSDQGRWVPRVPRPHRGQGFVLMKALMSSVEVEASDDGTRVRLRRR